MENTKYEKRREWRWKPILTKAQDDSRTLTHRTIAHRIVTHRAIAHKTFGHRVLAHKIFSTRTFTHMIFANRTITRTCIKFKFIEFHTMRMSRQNISTVTNVLRSLCKHNKHSKVIVLLYVTLTVTNVRRYGRPLSSKVLAKFSSKVLVKFSSKVLVKFSSKVLLKFSSEVRKMFS